MEFPQQNIINSWLEENGDPAVTKLVEKNLAIANKIHELLEKKGLKAVDLARMLDKKASEISKWLTGTHTFTTKTITKIEVALGEDIIHVEPQIKFVRVKIWANDEQEEMQFQASEIFTKGTDFPKAS
jgi:transcriptional regulator with XRE-family HTH domain